MRILYVIIVFAAGACSTTTKVNALEHDTGGPVADAGPSDLLAVPDVAPDLSPDFLHDAALPPIAWSACDTTDFPQGYPPPGIASVKCMQIDAPLDHALPDGDKITLTVARRTSRTFPTGKALFFLSGGPGASAVVNSGNLTMLLGKTKILDDHDLVYVAQRGTHKSGYLGCSAGYPTTKGQWESCALEHAPEGSVRTTLQQYGTAAAAHDVDLVRQRLGYEKITLLGGSYGTRLGLEVIRQHELTVTAAILDGIAPPDWDPMSDSIKEGDMGVTKLLADCAAAPACAEVAPELQSDLQAWREAVKAKPRPITIGGQSAVEDEALFLTFLSAILDNQDFYYRLPRAINAAAAGDSSLWNKVLSDLTQFPVKDGYNTSPGSLVTTPTATISKVKRRLRRRGFDKADILAPGLFAAVVCAEWVPNAPSVADLYTLEDSQVWPGPQSWAGFSEACASWNVTATSEALRSAVTSAVPVLLLSGEIDFRTIPANGEHAAKTLSNGMHLVVPYTSHGTFYLPCPMSIIESFVLSEGDLTSVDTSCLSEMTHVPW